MLENCGKIMHFGFLLLFLLFYNHQGKLQKFLQHISHSRTYTYFAHPIIVRFFIPVSSLKVFGHSIHSERRRIYLGDQYKLFRMTPLSYHDYSVSGSSSQQYSGIPLKRLRLFSSILVHHNFFFVKYLNNIDLMWLSVTRYKPKLTHGLI